MTAKIYVTPAPGLLVLDPATGQPLPAGDVLPRGTRVELTSYWHKRVSQGDVLDVGAAHPESAEEAPVLAVHSPDTADATSGQTTKPSKPKDK